MQAQSLNALCRAHQASGNTQRAIQLGLQSAELFQQINDHLGEARVYNTLGELSLSIGVVMNPAVMKLKNLSELIFWVGMRNHQMENVLAAVLPQKP